MSILPPVEKGPYTTEDGPHYYLEKFEIWAQDGLIWLIDRKTGADLQSITVKSASEILKNMIHEYKRLRSSENVVRTSEDRKMIEGLKEFYRKAIEVFCCVIEDAKKQGDQSDPDVRREKLSSFLLSKKAGTNPKVSTSTCLETLFNPDPTPILLYPDKQDDFPWKSIDKNGVNIFTGESIIDVYSDKRK